MVEAITDATGPVAIDQVVIHSDADTPAGRAWAVPVGIRPHHIDRYEAHRSAGLSMPAAYRQTLAGA